MITGSRCYVGVYKGKPVAFISLKRVPSQTSFYRVSRLVVLPDYQGVGIGKRLLNFVAELYAQLGRLPLFITTSNPQLRNLMDVGWELRRVGHTKLDHGSFGFRKRFQQSSSRRRITMSFKYRGGKKAEKVKD